MGRILDLSLALYFLFHIPITLLFASQVVIGPLSFPKWMNNILYMAIKSTQDPLLKMAISPTDRQAWAVSIFWQELIIQLPLFVLLAYYLIVDSKSKYFEWTSILYSGQAIGCFIPIMVHLYVETGTRLIPSYITFGIMPIVLLYRTVIAQKGIKPKTL